MIQVDFEVYGTVQGVFFRKYTQQQANKLGIRGWCMNTSKGTVMGVIEGEEKSVAEMKRWLESVGSPSSTIERAVFGKETNVSGYTFPGFEIRR